MPRWDVARDMRTLVCFREQIGRELSWLSGERILGRFIWEFLRKDAINEPVTVVIEMVSDDMAVESAGVVLPLRLLAGCVLKGVESDPYRVTLYFESAGGSEVTATYYRVLVPSDVRQDRPSPVRKGLIVPSVPEEEEV